MIRFATVLVLACALSSLTAVAADIVGVPRISDGDTVEIAGTKIRMNGIDVPESEQFCLNEKSKTWGCGRAARAAHDK